VISGRGAGAERGPHSTAGRPAAPRPDPGGRPRAVQRRLYVPVPWKLALAQAVARPAQSGLDVAYSLVWLPGLPLAATGRFWIVGPYTVAVLPLTLLVNAILYRYQRRRVFHLLGLRVRRNTLGLVAFVLTYQMLMSPVSVAGYVQELLGLRRRWK
jgi:hypothetical protein